MATHLYRIAQEAINIALRHGAAERIRVSLSLYNDRIALEVSDNGTGFNSETILNGKSSVKGMGMQTMEYRASLIDGRMKIVQGPDGGVLVRCEVLKGGESW